MDFLRTGFDLLQTNDSELDPQTLDMISTLMTLFLDDVIATAASYTSTKGRKTVTARDVQKALKYQAQHFFNQNESLEERYITMMQELHDDEEGEEEEGEEEEEEGEEEEGEEEEGEEEEEEEDMGDQEGDDIDPVLARHVDECEETWIHWNPTDPILMLLKRSIDNVSVEA